MHYPCALDACKAVCQVCIAPFCLQKWNQSIGTNHSSFHGELCHCNKLMLLHQHLLQLKHRTIEGIGKLGKGFGTELLPMPPMRQSDLLCISDLVESLRSCFCVHAGCQAYVEIRWGKKSRYSFALYKQRCWRSSLDFLHPVGIFSSTGYLSSSLCYHLGVCLREGTVGSVLSFFELHF
jgi:hypothetical protein